MEDLKKIRSALISVYHKDGLDRIVEVLKQHGVSIYSTGGTAAYLAELGATVNEVADLTAYPSILGGRVKTLHPKVFGGILGRQSYASDVAEMEQYDIPPLDLVIVDLYPFEATVASGAPEADIIEKIDIGGISLIRAAAKNFRDVAVVPSAEYYGPMADLLEAQGCALTLPQRKRFSAEAFDISSHYDTQIYRYMADEPRGLKLSERKSEVLRYGENPHQQAWFVGDLEASFTQLHGKALSYNNLLDVDAAVTLMADFYAGAPCFAILKHTNACGLATGKNLLEAYERALAGDPVSAFGGILICNGQVGAEVAEAMNSLFFEVLIADGFTPEALEILQTKKNRILLIWKDRTLAQRLVRTAVNGFLVQEKNNILPDSGVYEVKSSRKPTEQELQDATFGEAVVKHLKSNAIAIVRDGQLIGGGVGQTSRVDALRQAIEKAKAMGFSTEGAVLASDAFFPFADCAQIALENGITVLVEPGGSIRDQETIDFCEQQNMCLIFSKFRHFKH